MHVGHDPRHLDHLGAGDTVVVSTAVKPDNPEYAEADRAAPHRAVARRGDGRADGGPPGRRGGRHARQDHDHLAAHRRAAGRRRRPDVRHRRRPRRHRGQRRRGARRPVRRRGRRERRRLPRLPAARRDRDQRRGRPPRPLGDRRGLRRGVRASSPTASTPTGSWSAASTTPAPPPWRSGSARPAAGSSPCRPAPERVADVGPDALDGRLALVARRPLPRRRARGLRRRRRPSASTRDDLRARHRVLHRDPPAHGAEGRGGRRPRLRQLRAPPDRDRRGPRRRPARSPATGVSSSRSSRTCRRGPGSWAPRWGRRSAPPTRWWCATSTWLARQADPAVTGALVADAVPLPADPGGVRAAARRRRRGARLPGPGRATWSSPSAPATSPRWARRCSRCWPTARRSAAMPEPPSTPRPPAAGGGSRAGSGGAAGSPGGTSSCWCSSWRCSAPASTRSGSRRGSTSRGST